MKIIDEANQLQFIYDFTEQNSWKLTVFYFLYLYLEVDRQFQGLKNETK